CAIPKALLARKLPHGLGVRPALDHALDGSGQEHQRRAVVRASAQEVARDADGSAEILLFEFSERLLVPLLESFPPRLLGSAELVKVHRPGDVYHPNLTETSSLEAI